MRILRDYWFIIVLVFLFGGNLVQYFNPIIKTVQTTKVDTVTTVKTDSLSLIRAKAELNYLRSQLKTASGTIKYVTKVDTIRDKEFVYIERNFIASLDTTFQNNSRLSLAYNYPQNEFSLDYKYQTNNTKIVQSTIITEKPLFDFSHGIIAGVFVTPTGVIQMGIGYGFQLSF